MAATRAFAAGPGRGALSAHRNEPSDRDGAASWHLPERGRPGWHNFAHRDWASLLKCPGCSDYVSPPILQRQSGHLVCGNCRPKSCCPTCLDPLGSIRNSAMEKAAQSAAFPCKYAPPGCEVALPPTGKAGLKGRCERGRPAAEPAPPVNGRALWARSRRLGRLSTSPSQPSGRGHCVPRHRR